MNLLLALAAGLLVHVLVVLPSGADAWFLQNLENTIVINVILAVFNMLPIPPLDGGRVAVGLLPNALARPLARVERYGMLIMVALIFVLPMLGAQFGVNLIVLGRLVSGPVREVIEVILRITGNA